MHCLFITFVLVPILVFSNVMHLKKHSCGAGGVKHAQTKTAVERYNYSEVLGLSLLFYEAERSGELLPGNRIPWRRDAALDDRGRDGEDLTGAYFNGGDHIKFVFPMAHTVAVLAWGLISNWEAYEHAGQLEYCLEALKWGTDYFLKAHTAPNEFYGQVGNANLDHNYWGRAEDMNMPRPAYKIDAEHPGKYSEGSDLAGETSSALAATAIAFRNKDPDYSALLIEHAEQLFHFANTYRGLYSDYILVAKEYYRTERYTDELTWAAIWLYRATKNESYLAIAEVMYEEFEMHYIPNEFSWTEKVVGVQVLLAQLTGKRKYEDMIREFCDQMLYKKQRTPKGLVFVSEWQPLRNSANSVFICLEVAKAGINPEAYTGFAVEQMDYILGDGGRSYVVGYGNDPPTHCHHRGASCPDRPIRCDWGQYFTNESNGQILYGALVGGPDEDENYTDTRTDSKHNIVSCDANAGFQSALASLVQLEVQGLM